MKWRPYILMGLALSAFTGCQKSSESDAPAAPYEISVNLSTNRITIGDMVTARIEAVHPATSQVLFPELDRGKELVVRKRTYQDPVALSSGTNALVRSAAEYNLTSFRIGQFNLSTNFVQFSQREGEPLAVAFPETLLDVYTTLDSTNAPLRAAHDVVDLPAEIPLWLKGFLAIFILALVAALLISRFIKRDEETDTASAVPQVPCHIKALLALDKLEEQEYIPQHAFEPFYVELSRIVRQYLEDRFNVRAPEQTTEEFIRDASNHPYLSAEHQVVTRQFLEQSDLVKFAQHDPATEDMQNSLVSARNLVEDTMETEPPPL